MLLPKGFAVVATQRADAHLLRSVDGSLPALKKVLYGTALLSPDIAELAQALLKGKVPSKWSKKWDGPEDPNAWLAAVMQKKRALGTWLSRVSSGSILKGRLDLSEVFRPGTFVNALRQQTSRKLGCSMDMLQLLTSWDEADMKGCALHATIEGLSLQGAGFQGSKLVESAPNAPEFTPAPAMHVAFIEKKKGRDADSDAGMNDTQQNMGQSSTAL